MEGRTSLDAARPLHCFPQKRPLRMDFGSSPFQRDRRPVKLFQYPEAHGLKLTYWGRFLGLNCAGWLILATTSVVFVAARASYQLTCRRVEPTQIDCEARYESLPGQAVTLQTITHVRDVRVESNTSEDSPWYHVVLSDEEGANRIHALKDRSSKAEHYFRLIEQFLAADTQNTLTLTARPHLELSTWLVLGIWSLAGLSLVITAFSLPTAVAARLDPQTQVVHISHQYFLKVIQQAIRLEAIAGVELVPVDQDNSTVYRLKLILENNESIDVGFSGKLARATEIETLFKKLLNSTELE